MQLTQNRLAIAPLGAPLGVAVVAGLGCSAILLADPTTPGGLLPVCPTKALLGIDCPGCGSLRMLYSLVHGNIVAAAQFNALGLIAVVMSVWAFVAWTYGRAVNRRVVSWQHHRWAAAIALVAVGIWFVVRNVPIAPFTSLRV
jgi:Protein of unknown function (DUF2752)